MQQISVNLQDNFSYFPVILWIIIGLIGTLLILFLRIRFKKKKKAVPKPKAVPVRNIATLKNQYNQALTALANKYSGNAISDRDAFQELSRIVRDFVFASTGIRVQNYTLSEIQAANLPQLYELISQCYVPEFALETNADVLETIHKARKVIIEWK